MIGRWRGDSGGWEVGRSCWFCISSPNLAEKSWREEANKSRWDASVRFRESKIRMSILCCLQMVTGLASSNRATSDTRRAILSRPPFAYYQPRSPHSVPIISTTEEGEISERRASFFFSVRFRRDGRLELFNTNALNFDSSIIKLVGLRL